MKISALWITKNEALNIARTIESVKAIADEIVVVDTGSADDTVDIAKELGARVVHFDWMNDFSAARNFALEQVNGDIVVFPDADEWFDPSLGPADRKKLEAAFAKPSISAISIQRTNIDPAIQMVTEIDTAVRVLRGGVGHFVSPIHELFELNSMRPVYTETIQGWNLQHTGYSQEIVQDKILRNIGILVNAVQNTHDNREKALFNLYLVRECNASGRIEEALAALQWLMEHPKYTRDVLYRFKTLGKSMPYTLIKLAQVCREQINLQQLRPVTVGHAGSFKEYPYIATSFDFFFNQIFDRQDGELLARVDVIIEKSESLRGHERHGLKLYLDSLAVLYTMAGEASWNRGDRKAAFEYVSKAMKYIGADDIPNTFTLLLRTVKGLPPADIIAFLNSTMDINARGALTMIVSCLIFEGYKDVYAYYVKKLVDTGEVKKSDLWYMMIVLGNGKSACEAAIAAKEETEADVVQRTLYLAVASAEDKELYERYRDEMGTYGQVLAIAFCDEENVVSEDDAALYQAVVPALNNYPHVAFAGGREVANRLTEKLVADKPKLEKVAFSMRANYYINCGLYAEFLEETNYMPEEDDQTNRLMLADCLIMSDRGFEALAILEELLQWMCPTSDYFNLLETLTVRAEPEVAAQARALYGAYHPMYEEYIDYRDVVNTGVVMETDGKKQRKELSQLDTTGFEKRIAPAEVPPFVGQLDALRGAAGIFAEKKSYAAAVDCLCKCISLGSATYMTYSLLAEVFETLGNAALAGVMRERADELDAL